MALQPFNWSVIVIARWNPAILTPAGIAKRIFEVPATPLEVAVPLDGVSPYRVKNPGSPIVAMVDNQRLHLELSKMDYETLGKAMLLGSNALKSLPETPVSAAGFNVNFRAPKDSEQLIGLVAASIDDRFSDHECLIDVRTFVRSLKYKDGNLNLTISGEADRFDVLFNFHKGSDVGDELIRWLEIPVAEIKAEIGKYSEILSVKLEEQVDDTHRE